MATSRVWIQYLKGSSPSESELLGKVNADDGVSATEMIKLLESYTGKSFDEQDYQTEKRSMQC